MNQHIKTTTGSGRSYSGADQSASPCAALAACCTSCVRLPAAHPKAKGV